MIQLRDIRQDELPNLVGLCLRSKAVWGYDDAFMIACRTELTLRPDELLSTHLQVAERDTTVVGLAQIKVTGTDADLLKLFVEPVQLRSGVGRLLFEWAAARARGLGAVRDRSWRGPVLRTHGRTLCGLRFFKIDTWKDAAAHADGIGRAGGVTVIGLAIYVLRRQYLRHQGDRSSKGRDFR